MAADLPADVTLEFADAEDAPTMADLWVDLADDQRDYGSHLLPAGNRSRVRETMLKHAVTDTALVARRDGDIVGFVTFGQEGERYRQDVSRGLVHNIYVAAPHRDEGIGGALLAAAEETLVEGGAESIGIQAMAANDAARSFYRRHGYEPHRVEVEKSVESDTLTLGE